MAGERERVLETLVKPDLIQKGDFPGVVEPSLNWLVAWSCASTNGAEFM